MPNGLGNSEKTIDTKEEDTTEANDRKQRCTVNIDGAIAPGVIKARHFLSEMPCQCKIDGKGK
jgi:hypothetical protein